jgi:hypothetical protein
VHLHEFPFCACAYPLVSSPMSALPVLYLVYSVSLWLISGHPCHRRYANFRLLHCSSTHAHTHPLTHTYKPHPNTCTNIQTLQLGEWSCIPRPQLLKTEWVRMPQSTGPHLCMRANLIVPMLPRVWVVWQKGIRNSVIDQRCPCLHIVLHTHLVNEANTLSE